ncbi:MAG: HlyD family secretion protein [Aquabacterium sp.]
MKRGVVFAALTVAALAAAGGAYWYVGQQQALPEGLVRTNGRLEVDRIEVSAKYPGRIAELPVQEGDVVRRGDLLARQDTSELEAQRAAIEAARDRAAQAMARAQAETAVRQVQARLAQLELSHTETLRRDELVSAAEVDRRLAQRDGEQAGVRVATAAIGEATAARAEAEAQIRRIDVAIGDMSLRAPVDGRVEYRVVEPGSVIPSGGRVVTLLDTSQAHMTVFLPSTVAGRLKVGDEARLKLDAAPAYTLPARVTFVAAEAQFTPKYVETATERDKLVYRVKLAVPPELAKQHAGFVKAGLTGYAFVRTRPDTAWPANLVVALPPAEAAAPAISAASAASR